MIDPVDARRSNLDALAYGLFWSWNLIFLAFMTLGFAPRILPEMILAVGTSAIPATFLLYALILTAVPIVTIILGLTRLRRAPRRLLALGYVVEGPMMLLLAVRFFVIREATPALTLLLGVAVAGMLAYLWILLFPDGGKGRLTGALRLAGVTLMLLVSFYAAAWIAFYALPLAALALQWVFRTLGNLVGFFRDIGNLLGELRDAPIIWLPFWSLGYLLLLFTAVLFALTPVVVPALTVASWLRSFRAAAARLGRPQTWALVVGTVAVCGTLFVFTNRQPQQTAFGLLDAPPGSVGEAQALLDSEETIRTGLLNAYLAPFRYISAVGEVVHVRMIYQDVFKLETAQAVAVQDLYEAVARPLLYDPVHRGKTALRQDNVALRQEPQEAAELYERFFDQTIVDGERQQIVQAVRATWSFDQAEAAWLAVDDREVHLARQEINVTEHGDWAEVELLEVYQNQTNELQEVVYYFNLPESAVITGLWLGESRDLDERFAFRVAPRGAAQAVYREETRRMRDPALVEQIGPRQYRLRVYPVPPVMTQWDPERGRTEVDEAQPLYLWMTYRVMARDGGWPLPQLAVKRNVYWDADTVREAGGAPMRVEAEDWLPGQVPVNGLAAPVAHRFDLPGAQSVVALPQSQVELRPLPQGLRLAVVLDRSRSMAVHASQVALALERLDREAGAEAAIDLYLTASEFRGEGPERVTMEGFDPREVLYFGGQNAAELLIQFEDLRESQPYDAVLVFTDGSGYELGAPDTPVPLPPAPVWMVHLGDDLPLGYDDGTLEAIQASGGGVVGDLGQALIRLAASLSPDSHGHDVLDGYVWMIVPTAEAGGQAADPAGFGPLAARRFILAETQRQRAELGQLETLDRLHALAQNYEVVTPYSSMIVLVEADQVRLLEQLSQAADRFQREVEALAETTPGSPLPLTGVPEPHEWLLIGLAVAMLLRYALQQRRQRSPSLA